jgi:hypothetical protein
MNKARLESMSMYTAIAMALTTIYWLLAQYVAYWTQVPQQVHTCIHDVRTGATYSFVTTAGTFGLGHVPLTATALFAPLGVILVGAFVTLLVLRLILANNERQKDAAKAKVVD